MASEATRTMNLTKPLATTLRRKHHDDFYADDETDDNSKDQTRLQCQQPTWQRPRWQTVFNRGDETDDDTDDDPGEDSNNFMEDDPDYGFDSYPRTIRTMTLKGNSGQNSKLKKLLVSL